MLFFHSSVFRFEGAAMVPRVPRMTSLALPAIARGAPEADDSLCCSLEKESANVFLLRRDEAKDSVYPFLFIEQRAATGSRKHCKNLS